jgi:hypothetical protein
MQKKKTIFGVVLLGGLLLVACASAPQTAEAPAEIVDSGVQQEAAPAAEQTEMVEAEMEGSESMQEPENTSKEMGDLQSPEMADVSGAEMEDGSTAQESMPAAEDMAELPAFFGTALTHPATGEQFAIKDHLGKVILVENMAMWCSTCLRQQQEVKLLHETLGEREDFLSLGLDIDPNENAADLQVYLANNGFDWWYSVAPPEVLREIDQILGTQYLNPPSAPMFIIDRGGEIHPLPFGVKSAADLGVALEPFLNEGM